MGGGPYQDISDDESSDGDIDDDLNDKLLDLVRHHETNIKQNGGKKRKTQKQKQKVAKKGGTKKNK